MNLESLCQIPFKNSIRAFKFEVIHLHNITSSHQEAQYALLFFSIVSNTFQKALWFSSSCVFFQVRLFHCSLQFYLFIYGCTRSLLMHAGFLQWRAGATLDMVRRLLIVVVSLVAEHRLQSAGLRSCSIQASLPLGMWNLLRQ